MAWTVAVTARPFWEEDPSGLERLKASGLRVMPVRTRGPSTPEEMLIAALQEADAIIASSDPYTRRVLEGLPRLKFLVRWGIGVDTVDLEAATELGILIANVPGVTAPAVADLTWAMILALARHLVFQHQRVQQGGWERRVGIQVEGKTLGLIGFGQIGRAVARRARGFQMTVLVYDPYVPAEEVWAGGGEPVGLEELLQRSDFVSLHAPSTPETHHLLGEAELRRMKPTAYLINTARGSLVEEGALLRALEEGWIAGAGLDVYATEPLPPQHPLRRLPNVVLTPHSGFSTRETIQGLNIATAEAVLAAWRGEMPPSPVNPEVVQQPQSRLALSC